MFFSLRELRDAVRAGANTTPGQDEVSYEILKHSDDVVLEEILALYSYTVYGKLENTMEACSCSSKT